MSLEEQIKTIGGRKRQFLLLRIVDVGAEAARQLCGITQGTYNSWLHNEAFAELYRRRAELAAEYKQEALRLVRRSNQLQAILLEEKIIKKLKDEIDSGQYELLKTNLAREVYSKLVSDLDYQPKVANLTWAQRIQQLLVGGEPQQLEGGEVVNAEVIVETNSEQANQHPQSNALTSGEQGSSQAKKES